MKCLSGFLFAVLAFASTAFAAMNGPTGLAVDASGNLYVSNFNANNVQVYNPAHKLIRTISNGVNQPYGLAVDGLGFLHVANYGAGTVTRYDSTGKLVGTLLRNLGTDGTFTGFSAQIGNVHAKNTLPNNQQRQTSAQVLLCSSHGTLCSGGGRRYSASYYAAATLAK